MFAVSPAWTGVGAPLVGAHGQAPQPARSCQSFSIRVHWAWVRRLHPWSLHAPAWPRSGISPRDLESPLAPLASSPELPRPCHCGVSCRPRALGSPSRMPRPATGPSGPSGPCGPVPPARLAPPAPKGVANPQKIRQKLSLASPTPIGGRAGEREFPPSPPGAKLTQPVESRPLAAALIHSLGHEARCPRGGLR